MTGKDVIVSALESTKALTTGYFGDLADADLLVRPVPGANHIAWQFGHVIASEVALITEQLPDAKFPALPPGFKENHSMERAKHDGADGWLSKAEYLALFEQVRGATIAAAGRLTDADLDRPSVGKMAGWAPTLGAFFLLAANHTLMHSGQFSVVRRALGKPVLF